MNKTDKILSSIAHEYRSPLGSMSMEAEMISLMCQSEIPDTENILKRAEIIREHCRRLEYITTLALNSVQEKNYNLCYKTGNIQEFFSSLVKNSEKFYKDCNVKITFKNTLSQNEYCSDYGFLEQITMNLITNAIKFNDKKTKRITITVRENKVSKIFEFKDNGIGIEEKHLDKIFEKHYKVNGIISDDLGLGLYIVKSFVEMLCGKVTVKSEPGQGSTFTVALPKSVPPNTGFKELSKSYFSGTTLKIYRTAFEKK